MTSLIEREESGVVRFRTKLLVTMMLIVLAVTVSGLLFAQRNVAANVKSDLRREFEAEIAALRVTQDVRHALLAERCRSLARRPRIHAALEDGALDLLYPSARDELSDVMSTENGETENAEPSYVLRAKFYRFLDSKGRIIPPPNRKDVGDLSANEESRLALPRLSDRLEMGYLFRGSSEPERAVNEVLTMPIVSTETGGVISEMVIGFQPVELSAAGPSRRIQSGIWMSGQFFLPHIAASARTLLTEQISRLLYRGDLLDGSFQTELGKSPYLLFYRRLNPGSTFPPAYEISLYPLADSIARQRALVWQFAGVGVVLLIGAFAASHFFASRLSKPVEKLAVDSEENKVQRARAEVALEVTHQELQRSARFSADASHQLKTPITVLRAGLEELMANEELSPDACEELSALVHQTFRLTNVIEDLLLLSRMDAGRLQLVVNAVDLTPLIEGWLDDLEVLPNVLDLTIEKDFPAHMPVEGEKRYTSLILQNLLENARKYNRAGGRIRISVRREGMWCILLIGNTGRTIAPEASERIFERFHRGSAGENVPGHGLGLNLARELTRIHGGELKLLGSEADWTEFEVRFRSFRPESPGESKQ